MIREGHFAVTLLFEAIYLHPLRKVCSVLNPQEMKSFLGSGITVNK